LNVRQATPADVPAIQGMLLEAARWVDALGVVMWEEGELETARIADEVGRGQFYIADACPDAGRILRDAPILSDAPVAAGAIRFQEEDLLFWPDIDQRDSAFVHRLVVRRAFKGRGISTGLLHWAAARARSVGKRYLRLDCDASRTKLRSLYEGFGFRLHSYRQVGAYYVARYELPLE
jgi:GNAT superfamily N-acetyltransferase